MPCERNLKTSQGQGQGGHGGLWHRGAIAIMRASWRKLIHSEVGSAVCAYLTALLNVSAQPMNSPLSSKKLNHPGTYHKEAPNGVVRESKGNSRGNGGHGSFPIGEPRNEGQAEKTKRPEWRKKGI